MLFQKQLHSLDKQIIESQTLDLQLCGKTLPDQLEKFEMEQTLQT